MRKENLSVDFLDAIRPLIPDVYTDVLGNIIAHKPNEGMRVMLVAHHDVVRLMVSHIDERGFVYVKPSGCIDASILQARKVMIFHEDTPVTGIIGKKPVHLLREEYNSKISFENLWVDIGATSKNEALQMVSKGDYAYFCSERVCFNGLTSGAYLDDQIGVQVLITLAERLKDIALPCDLYIVASNHEEIGMRGAGVAAHAIQPDVCVCIDVTHATDYPTTNVIMDGDIKLGGGCVLTKGPNVAPELFKNLVQVALDHNIDYQIEANPYATGTDANPIQISGNGIKTALVSIPCRYMHTPHEICSLKDIESTVRVIYEFLTQL